MLLLNIHRSCSVVFAAGRFLFKQKQLHEMSWCKCYMRLAVGETTGLQSFVWTFRDRMRKSRDAAPPSVLSAKGGPVVVAGFVTSSKCCRLVCVTLKFHSSSSLETNGFKKASSGLAPFSAAGASLQTLHGSGTMRHRVADEPRVCTQRPSPSLQGLDFISPCALPSSDLQALYLC